LVRTALYKPTSTRQEYSMSANGGKENITYFYPVVI